MVELFSNPIFVFALCAGLGVALLAGPLGTFVVWRRMAYFGDAVAHSALLGVALGIAFQMQPMVGVLLSSLSVAGILAYLKKQQRFSSDTVLGIAAHAALALGVVLLALLPGTRIDLNSYLFGDILSVTANDLFVIFGFAVFSLLLLWRCWNGFVLITIHEEMAQVEGVNVGRMRLLLSVMLAVAVAVCVKIVGVLLITSLLILPAAAARFISPTPTRMAIYSSGIGMLAVVAGLVASFVYDLPSGPMIVLAEVALFFALLVTAKQQA